jgi:hypothetical protein
VPYRNLPALRPSTAAVATGDPALLDVDRGVQDMVAKDRADCNDHAESRTLAHLPRSVRERLSEVIVDQLLLIYRADDDDDSPALYHERRALS